MNKILKGRRLLSLLLAIILLVTMLPSGVLPVSSQEVEQTTSQMEKHPDVDKVAKLKSFFGTAYVDPTNSSTGKVVGNTYYPALVVITGVQIVGSKTYYQLSAAEGNSWPKVAVDVGLTDGFWLESSYVIFVEPCEKCGKLGCESGHENWCEICKVDDCLNDHLRATVTDSEGKMQTIFVAGDLPDGAQLAVSIPEIGGKKLPNVFDIKVLAPNENGEMVEWQPIDYGKTVTITIPVDGIENEKYAYVVHAIDCVADIDGDEEFASISGIEESYLEIYKQALLASGRENTIALEVTRGIVVKNGSIELETDSFSIYQYNKETKKYTEVEGSSANYVEFNNDYNQGTAAYDRVQYYYATAGQVFYLESKATSTTKDPFKIYNEENGDRKTSSKVLEAANNFLVNEKENALYGDWLLRREATFTIPETLDPGETIWLMFDASNDSYMCITIVKTLKITYSANGKDATNMPSTEPVTFITDGNPDRVSYTVSSLKPQAPNATFVKWSTTSLGDGTDYDPGETFTPTVDITLYAIWKSDQYTVQFKNNVGGITTDVYEAQTIDHGNTIILPDGPVRDNYTFKGWSAENDGSSIVYSAGTKLEITSDTILYAVWGVDLAITIPAGSTIEMWDFNTFAYVPIKGFAITNNTYHVEHVEGSWKGMRFRVTPGAGTNFNTNSCISSGASIGKWVSDGFLTFELTDGLTTDTAVTIVANSNQYVVSFISNGGEAVEPKQVSHNESIDLLEISRTGYEFKGWFRDVNLNEGPITSQIITSHTTFYAKWEVRQYTISFNANGGSEVAAISQDYDTVVTAPTHPTKTGYEFVGWYKDAALTEAYQFTTMPAENITLYAKWEASVTSMTIKVEGCNTTLDPNQSFLFTVEGPDGVKLKVTVLENGSVTIHGVTIGQTYTVTMDNAWSWRYSIKNGTDIQGNDNITSAAVAGNCVTFTLGQNGMLTFKVTRNTDKWLDGNAYYKQ